MPIRVNFLEGKGNEINELKKDLEIEDNPFIHFIEGNFSNFYKEGKTIGAGTSGVVKKCTKLDTKEIYAVKIVQYKGDLELLTLIIQEFQNLRKLHHKNVIKVYELYVDYYKNKIYTIMELLECGEIAEVLQDFGHYSGKQIS